MLSAWLYSSHVKTLYGCENILRYFRGARTYYNNLGVQAIKKVGNHCSITYFFLFPPVIACRQPPNFKRVFTSNKNPQPHPGTFLCNTPRCQLCSHIRTDIIVTGPSNYKFIIRERFTCTSSIVVYLLSCLLCPKAILLKKLETNKRTQK